MADGQRVRSLLEGGARLVRELGFFDGIDGIKLLSTRQLKKI